MYWLIVVFCGVLSLLNIVNVYAESVRLDEIVVVATREEDKIIRVPANVTVLTEEDIKKTSAKEITDILEGEAGIMVTNTSGSTPTGITVETRGFNNGGGNGGRTLVVVDGRKVNEADSSNPDWALIPLDNIERIEIIRGPATAVYGDAAMAAVVNIITKKGVGKPAAEVGVDVGSWQRFGQKAMLQGSTDGFTYYIFGNHGEEDGYRDNSNFRFYDWTGKFSYQIVPSVELSMKIGYHNDDRDLPGSLTASEIETAGRRGSVANEDELKADQNNIGVGVDITPDKFNKFSFLFYFNNNQNNSFTSYPGSGSNSLNDDEDDFSLTLRYISTHPLFGRGNRAILGMDFDNQMIDSTSFADFPDPLYPFIQREVTGYERRLLGLYLHDEYSATNRVILSGGIRFDQATLNYSKATEDLVSTTSSDTDGSRNFEKFTPKAAITYLFSDDISAYFSYAKTFRFPNRDELTGFFGVTPELNPENGKNLEIGMKGNLSRKLHGGVSLYHMVVEDEILFRAPDIGEYAFGQNENFDKVIHRGAELSARAEIVPGTSVFGSYTFTDTKIEDGPFEGSKLPITPVHSGAIGTTIEMGHGLTLWSQARFAGKRYLANDLANAFDKLPGYGIWDAKLSYSHKGKSGDLSYFIGVNNILDKEYEEFGGIGGFPSGSRVGFYPSPERDLLSGLTYKINF